MEALVITEPKQIERIELEIPAISEDEVLVRSHAVGLSESDAQLYQGTRPEGFYTYPVVPGSAWAGEVVLLGERVVDEIAPGDRVVVESLISCGKCRNCTSGEQHLCEKGYEELGFMRPGGLAQYVAVPARSVHVLPETLSFEDATLLSAVAEVAHAFLQGRPQLSDTVVIVGENVRSLLAVQIAAIFRPQALVMVGFQQERLQLGRSLGATDTVNIGREDPQTLVRLLSSGRGADIVFEGTGNAQAAVEAMMLARRGGKVLLEGIGGANALLSVEADLFVRNNLTVFGIFGANAAAWNYAFELYRSGQLHLTPLLSHRFSFDEYQEAFDTLVGGQGRALSVLVTL